MDGGFNGTDVFARSFLAVLAEHWLRHVHWRLRYVTPFAQITIDAQPMHLTALEHVVLADDRNVVFRLAGDGASAAADARG